MHIKKRKMIGDRRCNSYSRYCRRFAACVVGNLGNSNMKLKKKSVCGEVGGPGGI